mmetsp:Transcript_21562/g.26510  ORF Transcript_21562/g.26510 Transcript_21562/m.26510 type:complete len:153 (+) Transcript_21562:266-724(+)
MKTVHLQGDNEFVEILDFRAQAERRYGIVVEQRSCDLLKECTDLVVTQGYKCNIIGRRRADPQSETLRPFEPNGSKYPTYTRCLPVLDWNYAIVWEFLKDFDVPFCSLYQHGYSSLGEIHNSRPNPALQREDGSFGPAWELTDASLERESRI